MYGETYIYIYIWRRDVSPSLSLSISNINLRLCTVYQWLCKNDSAPKSWRGGILHFKGRTVLPVTFVGLICKARGGDDGEGNPFHAPTVAVPVRRPHQVQNKQDRDFVKRNAKGMT